jgi:hypothetical protein
MVDPTGKAQIFLTSSSGGGPAATHDLVVCARRSDTVLDEGTGNKLIGCTSVTAAFTPAAPMVTVPNKFNPKPMRPRLP